MLTNVDCKNAVCTPGAKRDRLSDSGGLYLEISPAGSKRWFWKYRKNGKEGRMALGSYPAVVTNIEVKLMNLILLDATTKSSAKLEVTPP